MRIYQLSLSSKAQTWPWETENITLELASSLWCFTIAKKNDSHVKHHPIAI